MQGKNVEEIEGKKLYKKIENIILSRGKSDHDKLDLILKEQQTNPEIFCKYFGDFYNSSSFEEKHEDIHQILSLAVKNNLFFTTKFFFDFFNFSLIKEKQILTFLGNRELIGEKVNFNFGHELKLKMVNLSTFRGAARNKRQSLLLLAARNDREGCIIKLLINEGADLNLISNKKKKFMNKWVVDYRSPDSGVNSAPELIYSTALGEAISARNEVAFNILINHPNIDLYNSLQYLYNNDTKPGIKLVETLIERLDNPEKIGKNDFSFLHEIFLRYGESHIFDTLLKKNINNINIKTKEGNNLLHFSILSKNPFQNITNSTKYLLDSGVDANAQNNDGNTALHLLADMTFLVADEYHKQTLIDAIEYLLFYQGDRQIQNNLGKTALDLTSNQYKDVFRLFYFFCKLKNIINDENKSQKEKIQMIKEEQVKDPRRFREIFLLRKCDNSISLPLTPPYFLRILFLSLNCKLFGLAKFMLLSSEILFERGELKKDQLDLCKTMINLSNSWDLCLLEAAIEHDYTGSMITVLMDYVSDSKIAFDRSKVLKLAISLDNSESVSAIINHASFDSRYHILKFFEKSSISHREFDVFLRLLPKIDDLERPNSFGENFLHEAIKICQNDLLMEKLLRTKKLNLNAKSFADGSTPLHIALSKSSVQTVKILLELGASSDLFNDLGFTPFDLMIGVVVYSKASNINDPSSNSKNFIAQELKKIFFEEKITLLLKAHGKIFLRKSPKYHDIFDIIGEENDFWLNLQSVVSSIVDNALQKQILEVSEASENDIKCEIGNINNRNSEQKSSKRQKI